MKVGTGGNLGLSREYHKKLFGPLFYTWWNCPLNALISKIYCIRDIERFFLVKKSYYCYLNPKFVAGKGILDPFNLFTCRRLIFDSFVVGFCCCGWISEEQGYSRSGDLLGQLGNLEVNALQNLPVSTDASERSGWENCQDIRRNS